MLTKLTIVISIFSLLLVRGTVSYVFIDGGQLGEQSMLNSLFYDVDDGYYVDIGAYDPFVYSNTLNLRARGWSGINVEAGMKRLQTFYYARPQAINLNFAVSQKYGELITFYQMISDAVSTINFNVTKKISGIKYEQKVYTITLAQLCQKYYQKRPKLMSVDIEGVGYYAFLRNNWQNIKCVPQVIISQLNELNDVGEQLPEVVLIKNGYKKLMDFAINQIFVHQEVFDYYKNKLETFKKNVQKNFNYVNFLDLADNTLKYIVKNGKATIQNHITPFHQHYYLHTARKNEYLNLLALNELTNQISTNKNRDIVVINFNMALPVIIPFKKYTLSTIQVNNYIFYNLTISKSDGHKFNVYILNHNNKYEQLKILQTEQGTTSQISTSYYIKSNGLKIVIIILLTVLIMLIFSIVRLMKQRNNINLKHLSSSQIIQDGSYHQNKKQMHQ